MLPCEEKDDMNYYGEAAIDNSSTLMTDVIRNAIKEANRRNESVEVDVSGVKITICSDSDVTLICRDWLRAAVGNHRVDSRPRLILTDVEKKRDADIDTQYERRRDQWRDVHGAARNALDDKLAGAPLLKLRSNSLWSNWLQSVEGLGPQQHTFGYAYEIAIMEYAVSWGRLMQCHISDGDAFFGNFAEESSVEADVDGVMDSSLHGVAVAILADAWIHGEKLLAWRRDLIGTTA